MPFTGKDWKDFPDTSTPITAAALEDLESRLATYTNLQGGPIFNVKDATYGAVGNDSADDTSAVQNAIFAANAAGGGTIAFPPGTYKITSSLYAVYSNLTFLSLEPRKATLKSYSGSSSGMIPMLDMRQGMGGQITNVNMLGMVLDANAIGIVLGMGGMKKFMAYDCHFKGAPSLGMGTVYVLGGDGPQSTNGGYCEDITFQRCEIGPTVAMGISFIGGSGATDDPVIPYIQGVKVIDCDGHDCSETCISNSMYVKRAIRDVEIRGGTYRRNALAHSAQEGYGAGHVNDDNRNGWVDLEVHGAAFLEGHMGCGAVGDHAGRRINIHDNYFEMGAVTNGFNGWTIALGEDNSFAVTSRTWHAEVHHNYFVDCGYWDFDSTRYTAVHHNRFFRIKNHALAIFGHQWHNKIEDNIFIECGMEPTAGGEDWKQTAVSCGRGVEFRRNVFRDTQTVRASLTTALTGTNNDLKFRAWEGGTAGNSISITYTVAGTNTPLSVVRATNAITVNVATNGAGAATSTATQVMTAVNASQAHVLLYANLATGNDGTGVVTALGTTSLAGGSTTAAPSQLYGVVELTGDPFTDVTANLYEGNDFADMTTPVKETGSSAPYVASYSHVIRQNRGQASISVASASTVTLPVHSDTFTITGTTNITSITANRDRQVTLRFSGALTVTDGSNLNLAGNMITAAGDVLILVCSDGTNWDEVSREQGMDIAGNGTPEGAVTARTGATYKRLDGAVGETLYLKESGSGNTGWVSNTEGRSLKPAARVVVTTNVNTASPGATLDGVTMVANDRVALVGQTTGSQNGLWVWTGAASAMTRTSDADVSSKFAYGVQFQVNEGTAPDSYWQMTTNPPITLGTTSLTFKRMDMLQSPWIPVTFGNVNLTGAAVAATYIAHFAITTNVTAATANWIFTTQALRIDSTIYGRTGNSVEYRIIHSMMTNTVSPGTVTYTPGLYPVVPAGATGALTPTLGTVVTNSNANGVAIANPGASADSQAVQTTGFTVGTADTYVLAVVTNATGAANSAVRNGLQLQYRLI
jgi:hypothetical protein